MYESDKSSSLQIVIDPSRMGLEHQDFLFVIELVSCSSFVLIIYNQLKKSEASVSVIRP